MPKKETVQEGWEVPQEQRPRKAVAYRAQSDFRIPIGLITVEKKQGELITEAYQINQLLGVGAPIMPVSEEEVDIIHCPHCKHKIELAKIPAVKDWMDSLKK